MDLEEELQDVPVGDPLGVEDDLDRLSVTRVVPVRRVLVLPTGVADPGGDDAVAAAPSTFSQAAVSRCGSFQPGRGKWQV